MSEDRASAVERFYDFHPISARQILDAVAARGIAADAITEEVLQLHDQDHYGGTEATDRLIAEAAVQRDDLVLDVCSGLGGPAVDLTQEWTRILVDRHAMYRSLETQTVARLGRERFERYDRAYEHFAGLCRSGVLAGALVHARTPN